MCSFAGSSLQMLEKNARRSVCLPRLTSAYNLKNFSSVGTGLIFFVVSRRQITKHEAFQLIETPHHVTTAVDPLDF